jgi:hypothetical protein
MPRCRQIIVAGWLIGSPLLLAAGRQIATDEIWQALESLPERCYNFRSLTHWTT